MSCPEIDTVPPYSYQIHPVTFDFRQLFNLVAKPALCVAVFALMGGHLAAVQAVAWGNMIRDYTASEGSVLAGVEKTFSGEAPCELCLLVKEARKSESEKPSGLTVNFKIDALPALAATQLRAPFGGDHVYSLVAALPPPSRADAPPQPVPLSV